ncbi:MAG: FAD-dependent oxidoreductase [Actinobacteria bacterium]|nr:FAD-dependent oxidoreductase [Actinomycetota bacterium]
MGKPTIIAVDDDAPVLAAVRADLRSRYADGYRIVAAGSGETALEAVEELTRRGEDVALFVVDQKMPGMQGTDFLLAAAPYFPEARKILLTAYADTQAAITSINEIGLDHYILKPWHPPEDNLYPVIDDLIDDWAANRPAPFDGIRVVGARWDAATHDVKDWLARNRLPYRFLDVERDPEARALLAAADEEEALLPLVFFADGSVAVRPDPRVLAERVGLRVTASAPFYDLVVVGAGPAGLAAAVYGASEGLRVAVIERQATGGQAGTTSLIENYLGFPSGVSGADLARRATAQAERFGAEILTAAEVTGIRVEGTTRVLTLSDGSEVACHAALIASGMKVRRLDVPGYERFTGAGVYYGVSRSEARSYEGEKVFVVGGANSAGQAAMLFSRHAAEVTLVVRGGSLRDKMSQYLVDQVEATPNIRVLTSTGVAAVDGGDHLERITLRDGASDRSWGEEAAGLFIFVGAVPHTDFLAGLVETNDRGFIPTGPDLMREGSRPKGWPLDRDPYLLETSVPGIFAAGDVRDGAVRRVASAVGQGAICVSFVHRYLETV